MNSVVKQMFIVLIVVGVVSGLVLAATEKLTLPLIQQHKQEQLQESIFEVIPEAKTYEEISSGDFRVFKGLNEQQETVGYAFIAQGPGFQGTIRMIVGIDEDLDPLLGMEVLEQVETPGLGAKIAEETPKKDFAEQFEDLEPDWGDATTASSPQESPPAEEDQQVAETSAPQFITYVKNAVPDDPNEVQAITGATISSAAVVRIINESLVKLKNVVDAQQ